MTPANEAPTPAPTRPHLPSVDRVLAWPPLVALAEAHGRALVLDAARAELAAWREAGRTDADATSFDGAQRGIQTGIEARVQDRVRPSLRKVFNLTGTVLHTNLGRAPLPVQAIEAMMQVAGGASNLEFDLTTGKRGDRDDHVEAWLRRLTGAEAATVVNNNAAALMLVLNTLAKRREVIVSRGELIEIGGAFRLPDIMVQAGCRLREVGTTNRTHLRDHVEAIGPRTGLVLKVHTSNYRIEGFSAAADERALGEVCRAHRLPFVIDLGSGSLCDLTRFGLPHEPTPAEALAAGADLVTFSGDKLLGGPQAGIVVGHADLIARLKKNPFKRALRCDKLTLAALGAVLQLYGDPDRLVAQVPTLRLLARPAAQIESLAVRMQPAVAAWAGERARVSVQPVQSQIGSGALPIDMLPSHALQFTPPGPKRSSGRALDQLAASLRALPVPVIGRIADGALWLDLRCLEDEAGFLALFESLSSATAASAIDTGVDMAVMPTTATQNSTDAAPAHRLAIDATVAARS